MAGFDAAAYKTDVLIPTARTHARALQQALAEMKDPATVRPSSFDLTFLYQMTSGMNDADIAQQLNDVEIAWNNEFVKTKDPRRKSAAGFVRQLHELLEKRNPDLATGKWWAEALALKQQAKLGVIAKLADALKHSPYAGLKSVTNDYVASVAANDAAFSALDDGDLGAAASAAGLTVVEPIELPQEPGFGTYNAMIAKLNEATDPTIVHAVFFAKLPASFSVLAKGANLKSFVVDADGRKLDTAAINEARDALSKSHGVEATARSKVISGLVEAASKGVDLDALVVYHLVDEAKRKCGGGILQMAYQALVDTGLVAADAARIVLSLDVGAEAKTMVTADAVRALLADGDLGAVAEALAQLESIASDDAARAEAQTLRTALNGQRAKVEQFRSTAAEAIRGNDIRAARAALLDAALLDRENEDISRDLASLPPEPPNNVTVSVQSADDPGDTQVRVSWQASLGSDDGTRYRVVRKVRSAPQSVEDGIVLGDASTTSLVDKRPELIDLTYYAVFATRGKAYSLPTVTSVSVVPSIGRLTLTATPTGVGGHWVNPARVSEVVVVQIDSDGARTKIPLSSPASFAVDGLMQGRRYRYEVTAHYRTLTATAVASEPVVKEVIPRAEAQPVPSLSVKPMVTRDGQCQIEAQWSRQPAHEVHIWYFPQPPMWSYGCRVTADAFAGKGRQLHGQGANKTSVSTLVADVPSGLLHYVAVTVDGDDRIVGQTDQLGICEPVGNPRVERFGDEAVLSWDWPAADYSVRAVWSGPSTSGENTITKSRYESSGGLRIRVGSGRSEIRLTTYIDHADGHWQSPPRQVAVEAALSTLKYDIAWKKKLLGGARGFDVTVVADGDVTGGDLVIGYRADRVMPNSLKRIDEVHRHPVRLQAGEPATFSIDLPKMPKHYWVRCFLDGADGTRLVDPPTDDLRGR